MARLLGHRQTKGTVTDKPNLMLPRHISTLLPLARVMTRMTPDAITHGSISNVRSNEGQGIEAEST